MINRTWKDWHGETCLECGSGLVEVSTISFGVGSGKDGDEARCKECGAKGFLSVCEDEDAYVVWHFKKVATDAPAADWFCGCGRSVYGERERCPVCGNHRDGSAETLPDE